jgi:hypothetical protein
MYALTRDYAELISRWLEPIDIYRWSLSHPRLRDQLVKIFYVKLLQKIDNQFRQHFQASMEIARRTEVPESHPTRGSYEDFVRAMISSKAIISGSFILQMINGEKYSLSDIDIYSSQTESTLWSDMEGSDQYYSYSDLQIVLWAQHRASRVERNTRYLNNSLISEISEYDLSRTDYVTPLEGLNCFQLITIKPEPRTFVNACFDFIFLKNFFWYDEKGPHIEITDIQSILTKRTAFDKKEYMNRICMIRGIEDGESVEVGIDKRIEKYKARGFSFD